jgi:glucosamine kinase
MEAVMAERLFLGIDGGGTTSRARLTDADGRLLGEGRAGSSNLVLGMVVATEAVLLAAREAIAAAGLSESRMSDIVAGLGLAGANVPPLAETLLNVRFPFASVALASDAVIACLGAFGGEDGAILILGTGSQGLAMVDGKATSIGGWGFELSDAGSGAVLGRAVIRAAMLAIDDLGPATGLTDAVLARFGRDPSAAALWAKTATPRDFGAFAPLVVQHFSQGDPVAVDLLTASARSVTRMVKRLIDLGAERIALMGGLAGIYRPLLSPGMTSILVEPRGDALDGALSLARRSVAR